ncbi:MAG: hypothetical protein ACYCO9_06190 [Streptosporangiaceae bacterium]
MLLTRLLPAADYQELSDGWRRPEPYQARHGRPPLVVRTARSASMALGYVRERYLGADGEDMVAASAAIRPPRMTS